MCVRTAGPTRLPISSEMRPASPAEPLALESITTEFGGNYHKEIAVSIKGCAYLVDNNSPQLFFLPIILNDPPPIAAFTPWAARGLQVQMTGHYQSVLHLPHNASRMVNLVVTTEANVDSSNGTFELPELPNAEARRGNVDITLTYRGLPYYRSEKFPYANTSQELNIFLYQPKSATISAGQVSKAVANASLPADTTLTANPSGITVTGSEDEASLEFGVQIFPDSGPDLGVYFDLALNGYNIHVGWPDSWCESADDILDSIEESLGTAGSAANTLVENQLVKALEASFSSTEAKTIFGRITVQFVSAWYPHRHSWAASDTHDTKTVISARPVFGYPRHW